MSEKPLDNFSGIWYDVTNFMCALAFLPKNRQSFFRFVCKMWHLDIASLRFCSNKTDLFQITEKREKA